MFLQFRVFLSPYKLSALGCPLTIRKIYSFTRYGWGIRKSKHFLQNLPNKYIQFQIPKLFISVPAGRKLVALFRSRYDRLEENTDESTNVVQETQEPQENGNH